jgi:glutathione S-transferase
MAILLYELVGKDRNRPFSPHCWKTAFSLAHKRLEFECVPTTFTAIPEIEGGVSRTVPVIRDGDNVIADSFAIALYLEEAYPERPSLFLGEGGKATARFVERWAGTALAPHLLSAVLMDIHDSLDAPDQAYFRRSREESFGRRLEEMPAGREERLDTLRRKLEPLRAMLSVQPFIGGDQPLFADYIVAGMLQWVRVVSPFRILEDGDSVSNWFERCLDLHDALGRRVSAAAA